MIVRIIRRSKRSRWTFEEHGIMKPAPFKYVAVGTVEEAVAVKADYGDDARFLAGGQSLMPALNFRLAQPEVLIDINAVAGGDEVGVCDGHLHVGALTRYRALQRSAAVARHAPLIGEALPHIAHPQIRNRGTIGGNLSHADPASELPAIMLAMGARMRMRSVTGERCVDARSFCRRVVHGARQLRECWLVSNCRCPDRAAGRRLWRLRAAAALSPSWELPRR